MSRYSAECASLLGASRRAASSSSSGSRRAAAATPIDGFAQLADGRSVLNVPVRAAASQGEANAALVRFIAATLHVAPRDVSLLTGATARLKRLRVTGDGARLAAALEKICAMG